jgi:orotate phosphoribosyltransferase
MSEPTAKAFLDLVAARHGHFRLESGHHGRLWLDLDSLFAESGRLTLCAAGVPIEDAASAGDRASANSA